MRKLFLLCVVATIVACSNEKKTVAKHSTIFIEQKLNEFIAENPDWTTTEAETTDKFKRQAIKWSNEPDFLKEMPLQLTKISDTTVSEQPVKIAVFKSFKDSARTNETLLNNIELEITGIFAADQVKNLEIDKKYTLKGMLYKQGKRADVKFIADGEVANYNVGKYTFWNLEANPQ